MRRLRLLVACALIALNAADDDTWSWGKQRTEAGDQLSTAQVVDNILQSGRSGKSLEGYDEVYADPDVQQAISGGNETQARHFIQERLCGLGLMTCELDAEGRYIQPHEVIYAQPVAIKPVGRPLPAIPLKGSLASSLGGVGYGPPRPVPLPPRPGYGPPSPYPSRPYKSGPYSPDEFPPPPPFKHSVDESKPVVVVSGQQQGLQTHVHHHFHHGDGGGKVPVPGVIDTFEPAPYPSAPAGSYGTPSYSPGPLYGNSIGPSGAGGLYSKPEFYKKQLNLKGPTYPGNGINGASSIYSPGSSYSPSSSYSPGSSYSPSSSFNPSTSYNPGSSYNPSSNYKPNYNPPTNNFNTGASTNYNRYPNYESPRLDADCYCVPFDQCLPHEIARKQDGYFIDPRTNGGSTIEALGPDEVVITDGNGTMTVVTKPKREDTEAKKEVEEKKVELTEKKTQEKKDRKRREAEDSVAEAAETEERKHKPREVGEIKDEASARYEVTESDDDNSLKQGRKFGLGGGGGGGDDDDSDSDSGGNGLKLRPTFGVSFGLPSGGGGYPVNPYGPNPAINPYYGSVGGNGLDLGLVSVNPLLSVQVTRDEYGEKVVKPLVNLHVTPNHGLVHKVGQVIHKFKEPHYGGYGGGYGGYYGGPPPFYHTHKHQHFHAPPPPHIYHHKPTVYPYKPYGPPSPPSPYYEPSYAPSFNSFRTDVGPNGYDDFNGPAYASSFTDPSSSYSPGHDDGYASNYDGPDSYDSNYYRSSNTSFQNGPNSSSKEAKSNLVQFPSDRRQKRETGHKENEVVQPEKRQAYYPGADKCGPQQVCCRRPLTPPPAPGGHLYRPQCGVRNTQGVNGRIKNPVYVDGDSEFGEYPWQVAILKKDPQESVYICGGTLIDAQHVITAAHCVKSYTNYDLRVRLGEWDVNHDVEFYPYVERDVSLLQIHPEFYAGTLFNDLAILRLDQPADLRQNPHISPACLPEPHADYSGARCYTTGWGKDAFGDYGKYQNILKEVDVPVVSHHQCEAQLQQTRLGYDFKLHPGFVCAGGEEGKDACKGDGGGPMVCERGGSWQVVGVVSWGIGCGQYGVPGVYVKVAHYLDWIRQIVNRY